MKITVFGSTGATGRLILEEGVRRGHAITAFARQASALNGTPELATVVQGRYPCSPSGTSISLRR